MIIYIQVTACVEVYLMHAINLFEDIILVSYMYVKVKNYNFLMEDIFYENLRLFSVNAFVHISMDNY